MKHVCRLYRWLCKRIGPRKLTVSAWLWIREQEGAGWFWRAVIDDWFLIYRGQDDHCERCYEHETKGAK